MCWEKKGSLTCYGSLCHFLSNTLKSVPVQTSKPISPTVTTSYWLIRIAHPPSTKNSVVLFPLRRFLQQIYHPNVDICINPTSSDERKQFTEDLSKCFSVQILTLLLAGWVKRKHTKQAIRKRRRKNLSPYRESNRREPTAILQFF